MEELQPRLAVDLGTTWTAASRATESGVEAVPLGSGHPSMPSVVARDGDQFVVGEPAERVLDGRPESGAREIKRRFGDTTPVVIDGQPFGADALMAEILRHVARTAHPDGWADVDVVLTHPANWGAYKLELLTNIGQEAGFRQVILQSEPVAAAAHFVESGRVQPGDVVAVYDFGGGTFDAAVVRVGENAAVLGTPQGLERLGGIDVDQMVFAHVAA
ncbi:MAG: Heat shock protein 70, partial [Ilumatobacteraceae bacterium]|nr:Heat shock protein 70 [Ilumatobacteraceae bacterium]